MSDPTVTSTRADAPATWWADPSITTLADLIRAAMAHYRLAYAVEVARRCGMSGHSRIADIVDKGRAPRDATLHQLSSGLGVPMRRLRELRAETQNLQSDLEDWVAPDEASSPFATRRVRAAYSELMRAVHEAGAEAYVAGRRHERELIAEQLGVDVSKLDDITPAALVGLD